MYRLEYFSVGSWHTATEPAVFSSRTEADKELTSRKAVTGQTYRVTEVYDNTTAQHDLTTPPYYTRLSPEPIDVIRSWGLSHNLGAPITYIARAGHKPGVKASHDLKKAVVFLEKEIAALEKEGK